MEENAALAGDNETLLQALVLRLLTHPADPRTQNPGLLVGQLPDALPVELPLPADSRLFGSLQRSASYVEVIFDTPLPEQEVIAFYRERLPEAGWQEDNESFPGMRQGGFVHTRLGTGTLSQWYQGTRGPTLHVQAFSGQGGRTDVRLNLDLSGRSSPAQRARMHRRHMMYDFFPPLLAPAGATQTGGGGGSGSDSYYSSATLETAADLTTLIDHYAGQLEQAGWTRIDEGQNGPLAWHAWTFQDEDGEPWRAVFFMLKMPGTEDQYSLYMRADWANKGGNMGGGASWTRLSSSL